MVFEEKRGSIHSSQRQQRPATTAAPGKAGSGGNGSGSCNSHCTTCTEPTVTVGQLLHCWRGITAFKCNCWRGTNWRKQLVSQPGVAARHGSMTQPERRQEAAAITALSYLHGTCPLTFITISTRTVIWLRAPLPSAQGCYTAMLLLAAAGLWSAACIEAARRLLRACCRRCCR